MPLKQRRSVAPNLDLGSFAMDKTAKGSSPLTPGPHSADGLTPLTPRSPRSSPTSPFARGTTIRPVTQDTNVKPVTSFFHSSSHSDTEPATPGLTAIPQYPPSPKESPKHNRDASKSFFANLKAPRSSHRLDKSDGSGHSLDKPKSRGSSQDRKTYISSKQYGSTPDLLSTGDAATYPSTDPEPHENKDSQTFDSGRTATDMESAAATQRKSKARFAGILSRSRSVKGEDAALNRLTNRRPSTTFMKIEEDSTPEPPEPPKSATSRPAKLTGNLGGRHPTMGRLAEPGWSSGRKERNPGASIVTSASFSHVSGASAALFNNLKQSSSGAADRLGKAGKGFFGKITRSGSTNERELIADENYVCSVINLPLVEQTRKTRIAKRLEDCRDKTEFWMPALAYRCIDYLNFKGCEEEGLYRVPGSNREVKHWQRRFDTEYDVNLFDVPDLYDINTVGSMFKAWLRELPDELFPKPIQAMIAQQCEGATTAPQMLKDELSKLPPYNYYLLFAITCHLNLLHSYVDQNKMDFRNLCICFQPSLKIDAFCFQFLVCDWKNCWQGCWTEKEYLQKELDMDAAAEAQASEREENQGSLHNAHPFGSVDNERAISSSGSSQCGGEDSVRSDASKGRKKQRPPNLEHTHTRSLSQLPELGPPLSPIQM